MKKIMGVVYILLLSTLFSACSNMTIGIEEDSIFYTEPFRIEAKEEVVVPVKEKIEKQEKKVNPKFEPVNKKETSKSVVSPIIVKDEKPILETSKEPEIVDTENETTFSYDPYEGE